MAHTPASPNLWADAWMDAQRKLMDTWLQMAQQGTPMARGGLGTAAEGLPRTLAEGFDLWSKLLTPTLPSETRDVAGKLFDLSKGYMRVGEGFWRFLDGLQSASAAGTDWQSAVQDSLQHLQDLCKTEPGGDPWSGFATFCGMPMDNWRRVLSSMSVFPGDMEKALRAEGPPGPETFRSALRNFLSTPTLGYTREWQEQFQEWGELWLEHSQALQDYQSILGKVSSRAMDILNARLLKMARGGESIETLRAAYDLWVDCGEEAYAEVTTTKEFTEVQAKLTNTLMALKRHEQQMMEELQSSLNMPTRRELDTTHRRVHEVRREIRALACQVEDLDLAGLRRDLDSLRAELKAAQSPAAPAAAASASPTTTRKAAPRKRPAPPKKKGEA